MTASTLKMEKDCYYEGNIIYDLISPDIFDGLIIMSNVLLSFVTPEEFTVKCQSFSLPLASLGLNLSGIPSVIIDNESGVYTAVSNLIDVQHYSRIGFLNDPLFHPDAQLRYRTYAQVMQEHNLLIDQELIIQGDFTTTSGTRAIKDLLDNGQIPRQEY